MPRAMIIIFNGTNTSQSSISHKLDMFWKVYQLIKINFRAKNMNNYQFVVSK